MIIPMLCVTIFVILVVWFLLPRVARLMIHTPTAISIFVCLSMVQLMAVFISMRCTLCGHFLSKQQQVSEIMRQMLTQAQTAGQYFTNDQIKEMTRKVSAEVDLVHQQTQNQRYGSSHIGATAKDISNVVTDAASGVVDIFHGIDKA